jgi:hypothetical protein
MYEQVFYATFLSLTQHLHRLFISMMYSMGHNKEEIVTYCHLLSLIVKLSTIKDGMMVYRAQEDKGTKRDFEAIACKDGSEQVTKSNKKRKL